MTTRATVRRLLDNSIGIKVFSATKARDREGLGDVITAWIGAHPELEVFDKIVTQSSDAEFHCLAITVFYRPKSKSMLT